MGYKYNIGDKVKVKDSKSEARGVVIERRWIPFSFIHLNPLPANYYAVQLQETYNLEGEEITMNWEKVEFNESSLVRLSA